MNIDNAFTLLENSMSRMPRENDGIILLNVPNDVNGDVIHELWKRSCCLADYIGYKVQHEDDFNIPNHVGCFDPHKRSIFIKKQDKYLMTLTVLHELAHALAHISYHTYWYLCVDRIRGEIAAEAVAASLMVSYGGSENVDDSIKYIIAYDKDGYAYKSVRSKIINLAKDLKFCLDGSMASKHDGDVVSSQSSLGVA